MVLIDTGCKVHTTSPTSREGYVFGPVSELHRKVWNCRGKSAAGRRICRRAMLGTPCGEVDRAARRSLEADGFSPGYQLPGLLSSRTGHGIGFDIHEWLY